jgi:hypothetical protein
MAAGSKTLGSTRYRLEKIAYSGQRAGFAGCGMPRRLLLGRHGQANACSSKVASDEGEARRVRGERREGRGEIDVHDADAPTNYLFLYKALLTASGGSRVMDDDILARVTPHARGSHPCILPCTSDDKGTRPTLPRLFPPPPAYRPVLSCVHMARISETHICLPS